MGSPIVFAFAVAYDGKTTDIWMCHSNISSAKLFLKTFICGCGGREHERRELKKEHGPVTNFLSESFTHFLWAIRIRRRRRFRGTRVHTHRQRERDRFINNRLLDAKLVKNIQHLRYHPNVDANTWQ